MNEKLEEVVQEEVVVEQEVQAEPAEAPILHDETKKEAFSFKKYLLNIWLGFLDSFKYNPCKLAGILVALPGFFIGFFLEFHSKVRFVVLEGQLDLSGFYMFIMVLLGCINIFNGVSLSSKRNLATVIISSVCSLVITVFGILWVYSIGMSFVNAQKITLVNPLKFDINYVMSIICVILAIICSIAGCILGYFKRNKDYKKVKF
ncbi:MAG: hypothetical protein K2N65_03900 [Anaeroplasmataceae bacterium]|nr:hypothetical protein [Anaeroplasmataceae bacterium]